MRILLSNDDGFDAPGIHALAAEMKKLGEIVVAAPADPQSAKSHSKAVRGQLKVHAEPFEPDDPALQKGYRVFGTPYDSVSVALEAILTDPDTRPDLVVTGINHGSNVAYDILPAGSSISRTTATTSSRSTRPTAPTPTSRAPSSPEWAGATITPIPSRRLRAKTAARCTST